MIEIKHLYKSFNGHLVLKDLSLEIRKGESLVIIGRSGCGKSVLLKHMIGLMRPDSGEVFVDGEDITGFEHSRLTEMRKKFGMLFQGAALFDSLTVLENVGFELIEYTDKSMQEVRERVLECLEMVELGNIADAKPNELSGGMKKRVGLARALCMSPEILLFDEPTTGVDPVTGDIINKLIRRLHDRLHTTSITVTHDMTSAYSIADRIAMLYDRKIIALGTPEEMRRTSDPVVKQFMTGSAEGPITNRVAN